MSIFKVTNLADSGEGSLRESIDLANQKAGADKIVFEVEGERHTINLTSGELDITDSLAIDGSGIEELTIDAGKMSRVFDFDDGNYDRLIDVSLSNAVVTGGKSSELKYNRGYLEYIDGDGAGIFNAENLQLSDVAIVNNVAEYHGGGISNHGNLAIINSTVSNNKAEHFGGAIDNGGNLTINNSTIDNNTAKYGGGGGINNGYYTEKTVTTTITNSNITNNHSGYNGGGIRNDGNGSSLVVVNSNVDNNSATNGGGIHSHFGEVTIDRSSIVNNQAESNGGGIDNVSVDMEIVNSTISGNVASDNGGGIYNYGVSILNISNSTLTDNKSSKGAGILNAGAFDYFNYFNNDGSSKTVVIVGSSIIAGNKNSRDIQKERFGNFISNGNNIIGNSLYSGIIDGVKGDLVGTPDNPIDPGLDVLQDNGGRALTHDLMADSPAIDAGSNLNKLALDGRGKKRVAGESVDVGALESNAEDVTVIDGDDNDNVLFGTPQDSFINGYRRHDRLDGNKGRDTLNGGSGHDTISGLGGDDVLNGGSGSDILQGDRGIDILSGGAGEDIFYINKAKGRDWIIDFELDKDKIGLPDGLNYSSLEITGDVNSFIAHQGDRLAVVLGVSPVELTTDYFSNFDEVS